MSNVIAELDGYRVRAEPDDAVEDPRKEYGHMGTMVCYHRNYVFGEEAQHTDWYRSWTDWLVGEVMGISREEIRFSIEENMEEEAYQALSEAEIDALVDTEERRLDLERTADIVYLPLWLYDHSGITMYTNGNTDYHQHEAWDSGQVGWIYVWKEDAIKWGLHAEAWREEAEKVLRGEVQEYDIYLRGDFYCLTLERDCGEHEYCDWTPIDSICGIDGDDFKYAIIDYFGEQYRALAEAV